jgi:hypothetical protein
MGKAELKMAILRLTIDLALMDEEESNLIVIVNFGLRLRNFFFRLGHPVNSRFTS